MTANFSQMKELGERLEAMERLAVKFSERAREVDENGTFPYENISELQKNGYTYLTVPSEYGGKEISVYEMVRLQEAIAIGDGSTALSIGWHMGVIRNMYENNWEPSLLEEMYTAIKGGALINSAATEPQTGSPTRGGKPQTTAEQNGDTWVINGRKSFTSMSPMLDYFIVSASIKDSDEVANFLIAKDNPGLKIEETWDSIALRGTGSHDVYFENAIIEKRFLVEKLGGARKINPWLLHIPACYLGIAGAAQKEAVRFAKSHSPNSITGTISDLPNVRTKIGEMELKMQTAKHFLYSVSKKWDAAPKEEQQALVPEMSAAKHFVTNTAIEVVDLAMRIAGARSLSASSSLQRYYRDVRAGLHNPPMDDMTISQLAEKSLREI
ncbi:acyl-CoA dehydrogenase family protein [Niallia taxi]|uniref:acyl-CoA dehydrogenase family protein n=1 Tax=Niallia taxi TaxID=2499688 RepID=UPI0039827E46